MRPSDTKKARVAHAKVTQAIRRGDIVRQPCCVCGTTQKVHAHHEDYARPLHVAWLCASHHTRLHQWGVSPAQLRLHHYRVHLVQELFDTQWSLDADHYVFSVPRARRAAARTA